MVIIFTHDARTFVRYKNAPKNQATTSLGAWWVTLSLLTCGSVIIFYFILQISPNRNCSSRPSIALVAIAEEISVKTSPWPLNGYWSTSPNRKR